MRTTRVYDENLSGLVDKSVNLIVNQGGTSSTKTFSICQLLKDIALINKRGLLISILSHSVPHLRMGVIRDMGNIFQAEGVKWKYNEQKSLLTVGRSKIEFISVDKMKAHGGRRDILFINEANAIDFDVFWNMYIRTKVKTFIDYNPTIPFWFNEQIEDNRIEYPYKYIHSTYKDNPFLNDMEIYNLDHVKKGTNYYRVYIEGLLGKVDGLIYPDWRLGEMDETLPHAYGVDFGHTDPDAIVEVRINEREKLVYVREIYYEIGNGTEQIIKDVVDISNGEYADTQGRKNYPWQTVNYHPAFICDMGGMGSKIIEDLRMHDVYIPYFAKPHIVDRIRALQDYTIVICGDSPNLKREIKSYIWNDKKAGVPMAKNDHLMDATGYVFWWTKGGKDGFVKRTL